MKFPIYWKQGVSFVAFLGIAAISAKYFNFSGETWYLFMGVLSALGISVTALWYYLERRFEERNSQQAAEATGSGGVAPQVTGDAAIDYLIKESETKITAANLGQGITSLANLPLVFVVGDRGTAKTCTMMYSGVEPELLSGNVFGEGNVIVPTQHVNIWYARGTSFVEPGGPVFAETNRWLSLIRRLKPGRLKALVGGSDQAPRGVLLCYDVENFAKPDAANLVAAQTREIHARLQEISRELGISFPVYVLFTRTDRVPFFTEFVRNLSNEEAIQVFGATLPLRDPRQGVFSEEESRRISGAFNDLFHSLCDKRIVYLPRDGDASKTPVPYEFPREFRKLRAALVQFLVDVCRPSALQVSPFLRGFYFAGVRPITVSDAPIITKAKEESYKDAGAATMMFRAGMVEEQMRQQSKAAQQGGGRRVPQWLFLGQLFNGVILRDQAAMAASGSSVKTSGLQRALLGLASVLLLGLCGLFTWSFFGNRNLESTAIAATQGIASSAELPACAYPSLESLQQLETLRQSLAKLSDYKDNGHPFGLGFGLYTGDDLYQPVRNAYYDRFRALMFGGTQKGLIAFMQKVPDAPSPTDDYGFAYDSVKAYLLTTSEFARTKDKSLETFLATTLTGRWGCKVEEIGKERFDLAKKQFDFYASDLKRGNPYSTDRHASTPRAQKYLSLFGGIQAAYQALLARADREKPPTNYNDWNKDSACCVVSRTVVRYAFTKEGYDFLKKLIRDFKEGEEWVLGPYAGEKIPREQLEKGIRELYSTDYVTLWRKVVKEASFTGYPGGLPDAEQRLIKVTNQTQPILGLFWWTTKNTNIDLPGVKEAFAPVHAVQPPSEQQIFIVQKNQPYNDTLMRLQERVAAANQPGQDAISKASMLREQATQSSNITRSVGAGPVDQQAQLDAAIVALMLKPITSLPMPDPGAGVNSAGGAFCQGFNGLKAKFPFQPNAVPEVTLQELAQVFRPGSGTLWQFYEATAKQYINCVGSNCAANPSAPMPVNPDFVKSFDRLVKFSRALYGENGQEPNYRYSLVPKASDYDRFDVAVNGQRQQLRAGQKSTQYSWPGPGSQSFSLDIYRKGNPSGDNVQNFNTLWSVFRFFANAERSDGFNFTFYLRSGRDLQPVKIPGTDRIAQYDFSLDTGGAPAVFSKDFLNSLSCIGRVTAK
jgi:type VI secretion system protein ImpL